MNRDVLILIAVAGWALAVPHYGSEFAWCRLALSCLMYATLATSWGLFCGSTRYLSLATSAFFGIGAYTGALTLDQLPWAVAIALGAGIAAVVALVMGAAVLHLRGTYFAVLTFGMTELIRHAITYWEKQVTGTVGRVLTVVPERDTIYLTVLGLAVAALATSIVVRRSRFGLALAGIGADEQRAQTLGVNTRLVKTAGFATHRRLCRCRGRGDERALDLHRPGHRVQPLHRLPDGADRPDRRRRHAVGPGAGRGGVQPAGRDAAPAAAAAVHDDAGPAADPVRAVPAGRPGQPAARDTFTAWRDDVRGWWRALRAPKKAVS